MPFAVRKRHLMSTKTWGVLITVPILIFNYIIGLIIIELSEIIYPKLVKINLQSEFRDNFKKVALQKNEFVTTRYREVCQNKRI